MTTILVLHDDRQVDEFEYDSGVRTVTIGRRPTNDVCIQDRSVSGQHARLSVREDGTWLEDLGSTNGTWLDGGAVTEQRLEDGDEVLVGKVRLKVHTLDPWSQGSETGDTASASVHGRDGTDATDEDSFVEASLAPVVDDDDELDESMRRALELYGDEDDEDDGFSSSAAVVARDEDDDEPDFAEDARLFARAAARDDARDEGGEPVASDDDRSIDAGDELSLTDRANVALGRAPKARSRLRAVVSGPDSHRTAPASHEQPRGPASRDDDGPEDRRTPPLEAATAHRDGARDDGRDASVEGAAHDPEGRDIAARSEDGGRTEREPSPRSRRPEREEDGIGSPNHELDRSSQRSRGAVIQIKNGAKSGQILPIDKPVTTLGRPGIQIAAIMRKPDGYFLMHIESDDTVDRPTLNSDSIGDEPVLLHSGDELNVAGIDVEFMLS